MTQPKVEEDLEIEEDFLEVDTPIGGQKYVLLSFVSPDKFISRKEIFMFHKYLKHKYKDYDLDFKKFEGEEWTNFVYKYGNDVNSEFSELVDFRTSVRGLKVRGSYETYREAKIKAARLQRIDRAFHVFIGQVGYWLPWDPNPDGIEDQEYMNSQLNTLIHEYQKNQQYKEEVFGDRVKEYKDQSLKEVADHKRQQELKEASEDVSASVAEGTASLEQTTEKQLIGTSETANTLNEEDPWMQRKREETKKLEGNSDSVVQSTEVLEV